MDERTGKCARDTLTVDETRALHQLLGIICLCLLPRLAVADAAQARAHFERGRTFFEVDEYRKAIAEFKAAHIEKPDPAFLYNIAECHRRLGEVCRRAECITGASWRRRRPPTRRARWSSSASPS